MSQQNIPTGRTAPIGTWQVAVAGVALVVASSTMVSEFTGFFRLGLAFVPALAAGFAINLLLGISAARLSVVYPRAGALYDYARAVIGGSAGRFIGAVLGLTFVGMFAFAASGETAAGAFGLKALIGSDLPLGVFVVILTALAVLPNILGIRTTAWISALLLLVMLGIRWFFGLAGFLGVSDTGAWSSEHMIDAAAAVTWFGGEGILTAGLALALWSFVGIEFACSLAEEVKTPKKSMPRGLLIGLAGVLLTTIVMGLGVAGTEPLAAWRTAVESDLGYGGDAPQLAVGSLMFGRVGYLLMALSSVAATLGTLTVAYAAMPRIIYSVARDGYFFGPLSNTFGTLHPRFGTPVKATLLCAALYVVPALYSNSVIDWLFTAAYCWTALYGVFHVLAVVDSYRRRKTEPARRTRWFIATGVLGIAATTFGLYVAFAGSHAHYGMRSLLMCAVVIACTTISFALSNRRSTVPSPGTAVELNYVPSNSNN